jgi:flagellar hook-associated protein 1 FlgK
MGLSIGLDTALKALRAHQLAVDVASHNIANAQSPGFSRQRVLLRPIGPAPSDRLSRDALIGKAGNGVDAHDVNRVRDVFLDYQARQVFGTKAQYAAFSGALARSEVVFNDPADDGLSALFGAFWAAWHDVVSAPESSAARTTLVHASQTLGTRLQRAAGDLEAQRADLDRAVVAAADDINQRTAEIALLNVQIKQVELNGDMANDLRDRRDLLLDELSAIAQVSYSEQSDRSVTVYLGSHELVVGSSAREVGVVGDPDNADMRKLVFATDGEDVQVRTGKLAGLLEARDVALPGLLAKLDTLASTLITRVNAAHQAGFGLDDSTGLDFFTGAGAADIALNPALAANPGQIAAASAIDARGDGSNALAIADLQLAPTIGGTETFDDYYTNLVTVLGADVKRAAGVAASSDLMVTHLEGLRQSVFGVNLDEELTNLNAAQHAYDAAARVITTIDDMLDTLINRTGMVGR